MKTFGFLGNDFPAGRCQQAGSGHWLRERLGAEPHSAAALWRLPGFGVELKKKGQLPFGYLT